MYTTRGGSQMSKTFTAPAPSTLKLFKYVYAPIYLNCLVKHVLDIMQVYVFEVRDV